MRDFTDDLKALAAPGRGGAALPAHRRDARPAWPSSRPRCRRPTSGTTRSGPSRSTRPTPGPATTSPSTTRLVQRLDDAEILFELAREEDDESQEPEIDAAVAELTGQLAELELRCLFTGEHDEADAIC